MKFVYRIKQLILLTGDLATFVIALWLSLLVRYFHLPSLMDWAKHLWIFLFVFVLWLIVNYINGLYDLARIRNDLTSYRRVLESCLFSLIVGITFFYLQPSNFISPKTILLLNVTIGYSLSALWRLLYHSIINQQKLNNNIIFVGYTAEVKELVDILKKQSVKGYRPIALIDSDEANKEKKDLGIEIYHQLKTIRPAITNHKAQIVVIAPHLKKNDEVLRELYELLFWSVQIVDLTSFYETITGRIPPSTFSESWFLDHLQNKEEPLYNRFRDLVDVVSGALIGCFFLALLPLVVILIKTTSKGPVFFTQKRVGKFGQQFILYKFRSMYALSADGSAELSGYEFAQKKDKRITSIGKILRKTRIDELPQAINLLKRDVTLIGPRPERPEVETELTNRMPYYPLRHVVRPGITGWAVLHQNYTDNLEAGLQKLQYDLYYIKNRSLLLDLSILLRTINIVIRLKGQ